MKKQNLPIIVQNTLSPDAQNLFLQSYNNALSSGASEAQAYIAAYFALQKAGYKKGPSGKWAKEYPAIKFKLEKIAKQDAAKQQVFGFFSVVEQNGVPVVDSQGDVISIDDIEKAAYNYVKYSGMGDERHDERTKALLIESMVLTKEKQELLGIDLGYVGWWGGFEVIDKSLWYKIESGEYKSFSIGGIGRYERFDL